VFSSPGTDDVPLQGYPRGLANQPRHRQWVPDYSGLEASTISDPNLAALVQSFLGPEIFVVIRTSKKLEVGDNFRVGIVSWGPATPSAPDPDTFPPPPTAPQDEFDKFQEFPWGSQAIGYVTMYRDAPDLTGFHFYRSTAAKSIRTNVITAALPVTSPSDIQITQVSPSVLPATVPDGGYDDVILGKNFGSAPQVRLNNIVPTINSGADTRIEITIPAGSTFTEPVTLTVTNTITGKEASRNDLYTVSDQPIPPNPTILAVTPSRGNATVFPVAITGKNFSNPKVYFGETQMPVRDGSTSTRIEVDFPTGGLPQTGPLDVRVVSTVNDFTSEAVLPNGFIYENPPVSPARPCFIATAAYGTSSQWQLTTLRTFRDEHLLVSTPGAAFVDTYYRLSPTIADQVARHGWLAALVRMALAPIVWTIRMPVLLLVMACGLTVIVIGKKKRRGVRPAASTRR